MSGRAACGIIRPVTTTPLFLAQHLTQRLAALTTTLEGHLATVVKLAHQDGRHPRIVAFAQRALRDAEGNYPRDPISQARACVAAIRRAEGMTRAFFTMGALSAEEMLPDPVAGSPGLHPRDTDEYATLLGACCLALNLPTRVATRVYSPGVRRGVRSAPPP